MMFSYLKQHLLSKLKTKINAKRKAYIQSKELRLT